MLREVSARKVGVAACGSGRNEGNRLRGILRDNRKRQKGKNSCCRGESDGLSHGGRRAAVREDRPIARGARASMNSLRSFRDSVSGGDVGIELSLDPGDLVLEEKLAPLHAGEG